MVHEPHKPYQGSFSPSSRGQLAEIGSNTATQNGCSTMGAMAKTPCIRVLHAGQIGMLSKALLGIMYGSCSREDLRVM